MKGGGGGVVATQPLGEGCGGKISAGACNKTGRWLEVQDHQARWAAGIWRARVTSREAEAGWGGLLHCGFSIAT